MYATGAGNLTFARLIFPPKKLFKMRYLFFIHSELECLDSRRLRTQQTEWISSINVQIRLLHLTLIYPYMPDRHFLYLCCKLEKGLTCCRARSSYMSNSIVELLLNTELQIVVLKLVTEEVKQCHVNYARFLYQFVSFINFLWFCILRQYVLSRCKCFSFMLLDIPIDTFQKYSKSLKEITFRLQKNTNC